MQESIKINKFENNIIFGERNKTAEFSAAFWQRICSFVLFFTFGRIKDWKHAKLLGWETENWWGCWLAWKNQIVRKPVTRGSRAGWPQSDMVAVVGIMSLYHVRARGTIWSHKSSEREDFCNYENKCPKHSPHSINISFTEWNGVGKNKQKQGIKNGAFKDVLDHANKPTERPKNNYKEDREREGMLSRKPKWRILKRRYDRSVKWKGAI